MQGIICLSITKEMYKSYMDKKKLCKATFHVQASRKSGEKWFCLGDLSGKDASE
jgi:hypothetical protein